MAVVKSAGVGTRAGAHKGMVVLAITVPVEADCVDQNVFIADQKYRVVSIEEVHSILGTDGSAVTVMPTRCQGTETPTAGDDLLTTAFNLKSTINTVVAGVLSATEAVLTLEDGDRIALDFTGTQTAVKGVAITIVLIPDPDVRYWISNA